MISTIAMSRHDEHAGASVAPATSASMPGAITASSLSQCTDELLFFDTFSHMSSEDNFDLVRFPSPITIDMIRIVPLGSRVRAELPGGIRLGATYPPKFELDFFINDLTKPDAHTFTDLGKFPYSENLSTDFRPEDRIPTDGLLLRGNYGTLTLAIFGVVAHVGPDPSDEDEVDNRTECPMVLEDDDDSQQPKVLLADNENHIESAQSPPAQTPASPVGSEHDANDPYIRSGGILSRSLRIDSNSCFSQQDDSFGALHLSNGHVRNSRSMTPNSHPSIIKKVNLEEISSSDEARPSPSNSSNTALVRQMSSPSPRDIDIQEVLEAISSSDDDEKDDKPSCASDKNNSAPTQTDIDKKSDGNSSHTVTIKGEHDTNALLTTDDELIDFEDNELTWQFDPTRHFPKAMIYFKDPSLTSKQKTLLNYNMMMARDPTYSSRMFDYEFTRLKESLVKMRECRVKNEEWVVMIEDLAAGMDNGSFIACLNDGQTIRMFAQEVCDGLDYDLALKQPQTAFKVRHLRAGIKLACELFHCNDLTVSILLESKVPYHLLSLYDRPYMSLPLRLLIIRCLDTICDSIIGIDDVTNTIYNWQSLPQKTIRQVVAEQQEDGSKQTDNIERNTCHNTNGFISDPTTAPIDVKAENNVFNVEHFDEDQKFDRIRSKELNLGIEAYNFKPQHEKDDQLPSSATCYQFILHILLTDPTTRIVIAIGSLLKKINLYESIKRLSLQISELIEAMPGDVTKSTSLELEMIGSLKTILRLTRNECAKIAQPIRHLPAIKQFHAKHHRGDPCVALFKWIKSTKLVASITSVLKIYLGSNHNDVSVAHLLLDLIDSLISTPRGARFFKSDDLVNCSGDLLQTLFSVMPPENSTCNSKNLLHARAHDLALRTSFHLKVLECIDRLFYFHNELINGGIIETDQLPEPVLHELLTIVDHPYGRDALAKQLSICGNLDCLLRFLDLPSPLSKTKHRAQLEFDSTTCVDYALELLEIFLRLNESVQEVSEEYMETFVEISKAGNPTIASRVRSFQTWLNPLQKESHIYTEDYFKQLVRIIRRSIPDYSKPFADKLSFKIPSELVTAVRVLRQLCIPPEVTTFLDNVFNPFKDHALDSSRTDAAKSPSFLPSYFNIDFKNNVTHRSAFKNHSSDTPFDAYMPNYLTQLGLTSKLYQPYDDDICGSLKYHYSIVQVFENEGLRRLLVILKELNGNYSNPIHQSAALSGINGYIIISFIKNIITLILAIVSHSIDAKGSDFKDTSAIPVILETYSLLSFVPETEFKKHRPSTPQHPQQMVHVTDSVTTCSVNYQIAQQTQKLILSILMSYTQLCLSVSESEEKLISKSVWSRMLQEIIEFTLSAPVFFVPGLDVLTKILPSPLPCSSVMDSIDQEQLFKNVNHRKLWSAHLHPLHGSLERIISYFCISCQPQMRTLLAYMCVQLCDLSSTTACMTAKCLQSSLLDHASKVVESSKTDTPSSIDSDKRSHIGTKLASRKKNEGTFLSLAVLKFITILISNQAFESAFTNSLLLACRKDEKYLRAIQSCLELLRNYGQWQIDEQPSVAGNTAQLAVVSLVESIKSLANDLNANPITISENGEKPLSASPALVPPQTISEINLIDLMRRCGDHFDLVSGLRKSYRLKVLLDINSNSHRARSESSKRIDYPSSNYSELALSSSKRPYIAPPPLPPRGRSRPPLRGDPFRFRSQNTSRPPSIHVDDFNNMYGDSSSKRYSSPKLPPPVDQYRSSSNRRQYYGPPSEPPSYYHSRRLMPGRSKHYP